MGIGLNVYLSRMRGAFARPWLLPGDTLDVGCGRGIPAKSYWRWPFALDGVDASPAACEVARKTGLYDTVWCAELDTFSPGKRYQNLVLAHVLEHLPDPVAFLVSAREWLLPHGRIIATVPNAYSFHRLLGVAMGLLAHATDLDQGDRAIGHRRVLTPFGLRQCVTLAGFRILEQVGYFFKPLPNAQIEEQCDEEMIDILTRAGEAVPNHGAEIGIVGER